MPRTRWISQLDICTRRSTNPIAAATARVIRPGGAFLVYQFSPKVRDFIAPVFDRLDRGFEWVNVPPATLFWAWRNEA